MKKQIIELGYDELQDRIYISFPHEGRVGFQLMPTATIRQTDIVPFLRAMSVKATRELGYMRDPASAPKRVQDQEYHTDEDGKEVQT